MKAKKLILMFAVITALFFSSCKCCGPRSSSASGSSLQDTVLPKLLVKFVHTSSANYLAYYWTNSLVVDTTKSPMTLTLNAQSAYYDATNNSSIIHNGSTTSQVSSTVSVNNDTVSAIYAGSFDPVAGQLYTYKGYLYYNSKTAGATQICPISSIVYYNQNGAGQPIAIGYVGPADLHAPVPPKQN